MSRTRAGSARVFVVAGNNGCLSAIGERIHRLDIGNSYVPLFPRRSQLLHLTLGPSVGRRRKASARDRRAGRGARAS